MQETGITQKRSPPLEDAHPIVHAVANSAQESNRVAYVVVVVQVTRGRLCRVVIVKRCLTAFTWSRPAGK